MDIALPRNIEVLCRDLLAADSGRRSTIELADEMAGALTYWADKLRDEERAEQEEQARAERREMRRLEAWHRREMAKRERT